MNMNRSDHIIMGDPWARQGLSEYETSIPSLTIDQKIRDIRIFSDLYDEQSVSKVLLLALTGEPEVTGEIRRIFSWRHRKEKATFLLMQLNSEDEPVMIEAIRLLGILKERLVIPYLDLVFDLERAAVCAAILGTIGEMDDPLGARMMMRALLSKDKEIVLLAVKKLTGRVEDVPFQVFVPLLSHGAGEVRTDAAFAIAVRRVAKSGRLLLKRIGEEKDRIVRRSQIRYCGMIPDEHLLMPLLFMSVHDEDQKARLAAARTIDHLQGQLSPSKLFRLRRTPDIPVRTEVLFRLGKFGSEDERHKNFIRRTLIESKEPVIVHACLLALGHIADRDDLGLIAGYLDRDPLTSYLAALALTKIWRLENADDLINSLAAARSSTIKQVFLKYLIRRRGFSADPVKVLKVVEGVLEKDDNLSVRYLSLCALEFAPSDDTARFLLSFYPSARNDDERAAIDNAMRSMTAHHGDIVLSVFLSCDDVSCLRVIEYVPDNMPRSFYGILARKIFERYSKEIADEALHGRCEEALGALMRIPAAVKEIIGVLPDSAWKKVFLTILLEHADRRSIASIRKELVAMLGDPDPAVTALAMMFIISLKDPEMVPYVVAVAESQKSEHLRTMAQNITDTFIKEGIL